MDNIVEKKAEFEVFKIDGCDLYFIDDLVYIASNNYSHFYKLIDAFNFYKKVQKLLNKKIVFNFALESIDYEFLIDENTNYYDVIKQLEKQIVALKTSNKSKEKVIFKKKIITKSDKKIIH